MKQESIIPCEIDFDCPEDMACRMICKKTCKSMCIKMPPRSRKERPGFFYSETPFEWIKQLRDEPLATPLTISESELEEELKHHGQQLSPAIGLPESSRPHSPPTLPPRSHVVDETPSEDFTTASPTSHPSATSTLNSSTLKFAPPSFRPLPPSLQGHETGYEAEIAPGRLTTSMPTPPPGFDESIRPKFNLGLNIVPSGYDSSVEGTPNSRITSTNGHPIEPSGYEIGGRPQNAAMERGSSTVRVQETTLRATESSDGYEGTQQPSEGVVRLSENGYEVPASQKPNLGVEKSYTQEHEAPSAGYDVPPSISPSHDQEATSQPSLGVDKPREVQEGSYEAPSAGIAEPAPNKASGGYHLPNAAVEKPQNAYEPQNLGVEKPETSAIPLQTTETSPPYKAQSPGINKIEPSSSQGYEEPSAGVEKSTFGSTSSVYEKPSEAVNKPVPSQAPIQGYEAPSEGVNKPMPTQEAPVAYENPNLGVDKTSETVASQTTTPEPSPGPYEAPSAGIDQPRPSTNESMILEHSPGRYEPINEGVDMPVMSQMINEPSGYAPETIRPKNAAVEGSKVKFSEHFTTQEPTRPQNLGPYEGQPQNLDVEKPQDSYENPNLGVESGFTTQKLTSESHKMLHNSVEGYENPSQGVEAHQTQEETTKSPSTEEELSEELNENTIEPFNTFPYDVFPSPKPEPPMSEAVEGSNSIAEGPKAVEVETTMKNEGVDNVVTMMMAKSRLTLMETTESSKNLNATDEQNNCPPPPICDKNCGIAQDENGCQTCHCLWLSIPCNKDEDCRQEGQFCDLGRCNCIDGYKADIHQSGVCIPDEDFKETNEVKPSHGVLSGKAESQPFEGPCSNDDQCPAGLYCIQGECWQLPDKPIKNFQEQVDFPPESFPISQDGDISQEKFRGVTTHRPRTTTSPYVIESFAPNEFPSEPKEDLGVTFDNTPEEEGEAQPPAPPPQLNDYEAEIFGRFLTTSKPEFYTKMIEVPEYEVPTKKPPSSLTIKKKLRKTNGPKRRTYGSKDLLDLPDILNLKNTDTSSNDYPQDHQEKPQKIDSDAGQDPINYEDYGTYPLENKEDISGAHLSPPPDPSKHKKALSKPKIHTSHSHSHQSGTSSIETEDYHETEYENTPPKKNPEKPSKARKPAKRPIVSPEGWKPMDPNVIHEPYNFRIHQNKKPENSKIFLDYSPKNRLYRPIRVEMHDARDVMRDECKSDRDCGPRYVCCEKRWCDLSKDCGRGKFCLPDCRMTKMTHLGRTNDDGQPLIDLVYD